MKMIRMPLSLPEALKAKLDEKRKEGYTAAGFIRSLLERELAGVPRKTRKGR